MELSQPVLIIEDNDDDFEAIIRAFKQLPDFNYRIDRCADGDEAIDYLFRRGPFANLRDYNLPGLLLLDLNMPGTGGLDVLKAIKSKKHLSTIPTIIMTTSQDTDDIQNSYASGANTFIAKPQSYDDLTRVVHRFAQYWLNTASLPKPKFDPLGFQMGR